MTTTIVQNTFLPTQISGCQLWFDAADRTTFTLNGSAVSSWRDKSANGYSVGQATGGNQPTYATNLLNGLPGIQLSASTYLYQVGSSMPNFASATAVTVFIVAKNGSSYPSGGWNIVNTMYFGGVSTQRYHFSFGQDFANGVTLYANNSFIGQTTVVPLNTNAIIGFTVASTGTNIDVNGTLTNYTGASLISANNSTWFIFGDARGTYVSDVNIYEFIGFSSTLTTAQRQQVEGYLAQKWGLQTSLPSNHPYRYSAYFTNQAYVSTIVSPNVTNRFTNAVFLPTTIPGCTLWLDAADSSTVTGTSTVTAWADKSGQGYNMVNGGGTTTYTIYGPGPSIKLNTSYLFVNKAVNLLQYTVFSVLLSQTAVGNQPTITGRPNTTASYDSTDGFGLYVDSDYPRLRFYGTNLSYPTYNNTTAGTNAQPLVLSSYTCSSAGVVFSWINGAAGGSTTSGGSARTTTAQGFSIGGEWNGSAYVSQFQTGCVANVYEVIVFNTVLTTTQRQQVEGYLAWKWGLVANLPSNYPYKNTSAVFATQPTTLAILGANPYNNTIVCRYFNPTSIPGCQLWLDAADTTTITGTSPVTAWRDKSGTGRTVSFTGTNTYTTSPASVNTNTAGSYFSANTDFRKTTVPNVSMFLVYKWNTFTAGTNQALWGTDSGGGWQRFQLLTFPASTDIQYGLAYRATIAPTTVAVSGINNANSLLYNVNYLYGVVNGTYVNVNGSLSTSLVTEGAASPQTSYSGISFANLDSAGGYCASVSFSEIIIYYGTLTTAQRQQVEGYLAWKWGLQANLPATHPNKNYPPPP